MFLRNSFNSILLYTPRSSKLFFFFRFPHQNSLLSLMFHIPPPPHVLLLDLIILLAYNILCEIEINKVLCTFCFSASLALSTNQRVKISTRRHSFLFKILFSNMLAALKIYVFKQVTIPVAKLFLLLTCRLKFCLQTDRAFFLF